MRSRLLNRFKNGGRVVTEANANIQNSQGAISKPFQFCWQRKLGPRFFEGANRIVKGFSKLRTMKTETSIFSLQCSEIIQWV